MTPHCLDWNVESHATESTFQEGEGYPLRWPRERADTFNSGHFTATCVSAHGQEKPVVLSNVGFTPHSPAELSGQNPLRHP